MPGTVRMEAYEQWLLQGGEEGKREVAILRLMGLFDRHADASSIKVLSSEIISELNEPLVCLSEEDRSISLSKLEESHLLTVNRDDSGELISVDAHPLLREYFAGKMPSETRKHAEKLLSKGNDEPASKGAPESGKVRAGSRDTLAVATASTQEETGISQTRALGEAPEEACATGNKGILPGERSMISNPHAERLFSTALLASESFHRLQRELFELGEDLPIDVVKLFELKLEEFLDTYLAPTVEDAVSAIVLGLTDLAHRLQHTRVPRAANIIEHCCQHIVASSRDWNYKDHLEYLHQIARTLTSDFFAGYPGGCVLPSEVRLFVRIAPSGAPLAYTVFGAGVITLNFTFQKRPNQSMSIHQWHLCCPLTILHEYVSHIAIKHRTFPEFDDGWMIVAVSRFLIIDRDQ
jgi:hypothetical protein